MVEGNDNMREKTNIFFQGLYKEELEGRLKLDGIKFNELNPTSRDNLEKEFFEEEILEGLRSCNGDEAPRLDDFNMRFLQTFWHIIKDGLIEVFRNLYHCSTFVKSLNSTFLVLIAKMKGTKNIKHFRPISLSGCIYQLISKVGKMSMALGEVIGECQHFCWE